MIVFLVLIAALLLCVPGVAGRFCKVIGFLIGLISFIIVVTGGLKP